MAFPKRYVRARPPEYGDLSFRLLANPTGTLYTALLMGDASTPESSKALGEALVEAYAGEKYEGYGVVMDFSTADAAIATITNEALPIDLRVWLRNAPIDLVAYEREALIGKNFSSSLITGT